MINEKKLYIWKLAEFLYSNNMVMSGSELAEHLNRNNFLTSYGSEFKGKRGVFTLIQYTYDWLDELKLKQEAEKVARAFVNEKGEYAYEKD